jgi:hypothetical protein
MTKTVKTRACCPKTLIALKVKVKSLTSRRNAVPNLARQILLLIVEPMRMVINMFNSKGLLHLGRKKLAA